MHGPGKTGDEPTLELDNKDHNPLTGSECKKKPNWRMSFDFSVTTDPAPVACACFLEAYVQAAIDAGCRRVSFYAVFFDPLPKDGNNPTWPRWAAQGEGAESGAPWVYYILL